MKGEFTNHISPDPEGPAIGVTWYMAAQYCNWLSAKDNIPEKEWCYPRHADIKAGMKPVHDYLQKRGYRLPTEAECEHAARAGTVSIRSYGSCLELLPRYAWFQSNSKPEGGENRAWPVGQKRPNDLGLLDMHGNVYNWVQDRYFIYPEQKGTVVFVDREDLDAIDEKDSRVFRGGASDTLASEVRSTARAIGHPAMRNFDVGLRVARTIVDDGPKPRTRQAP